MEITGRTLTAATIQHQDQIPSGPIVFDNCELDGPLVSPRPDATEYLRVRELTVRGGRITGGAIRGLIVEDTVVDGITVANLPAVQGCLFNRVTLRGSINQILIETRLAAIEDPKPFYRIAEHWYEKVDWALDISQLDCPDLNIRGLPSRLIRLNPETHIVLRRDRAEAADWTRFDLTGLPIKFTIRRLLRSDWEDVILNVPRSGAKAAETAEIIARLRGDGIVDAA